MTRKTGRFGIGERRAHLRRRAPARLKRRPMLRSAWRYRAFDTPERSILRWPVPPMSLVYLAACAAVTLVNHMIAVKLLFRPVQPGRQRK